MREEREIFKGVKMSQPKLQSKKLKAAMKQIDAIIEKHDISACVILADGKACGEFKMYYNTPSWSLVKFKQQPDGGSMVTFEEKFKEKQEQCDMTVNSLVNISNMITHVGGLTSGLVNAIGKILTIEQGKGIITPHNNPPVKKKGLKLL